MVKIGLQIKADLEHVSNLLASGDDFRWYLKLKCANCGEEGKEYQYLTLLENSPLKGGRGHASLVVKCKLCGRENSIDILKDTIVPYTAEDSGKFKTIVVFDCRGVEPTDFSPRTGFTTEGAESGTKFTEVTLTEKEWCDYDESANTEVGIYSLEHKFIKVK
ncbi:UPF0587 protein v1g245604 [Lingula anatina]|uniref:UPF0587 protein v1g245604 n=1 Tax=Lingula anatina TaxID=7574 RepID=A0A1S3J431_LINAN|nr:UPF0587 protein v1g245604 [Lingula anatina]|eukprot:XP_013405038.1 UPF0587 protein v1g245604 [Lingula anatina]